MTDTQPRADGSDPTDSPQPEGRRTLGDQHAPGDQRTPAKRYTRRRLLTTGVVTAGAAAALGAGAGAFVADDGTTPPVIQPSGRRRFAGKVVIVTGATSGIGRAAARQFAAEGGKVGFCGRRETLGAEVEREIRAAGGEATYIRADVRDEAQVRAFVDQVAQKYGGLDVCFNNAGITLQKPLHEYTAQEWDDVVGTNLRGTFLSMKYQVPHLIRRGGGTVVITSSSNVHTTSESKAAYTASKHGLLGLANCAAFDYAKYNIRVNTLIPGTTNTELVRGVANALDLPDAVWDRMAAIWGRDNVPTLRRMATPDEIAVGALALASPDFTYLTGNSLTLDAGGSFHA
ncbi:SDR family oxidoreductase [Nonomuraea sp. NN258]|uniref:SDR family NAD(P)-dependent oxidoreductase n=1 Tax=Nonomuraea antri TaxID=2730852 RepID=UPI00156867DB|nr:SDR family NAD(P)-dependent oxidoreductase [Nonomuraea antri]NRQ39455.1 SDR family oxidoreductase [Nonomuraea antri]